MTAQVGQGRLAENVVHFGRLLREAGLSIGPGDILHAIDAVRAVGLSSRDELYWALHCVLVFRREDHGIFHQAFQLFWRNPRFLDQMRAALLPQVRAPVETDMPELSRRLVEAVATPSPAIRKEDDRIELDATFTSSAEELLSTKDFEQMSAEELRLARKMLKTLSLPQQMVRTRRYQADNQGVKIDLRRSVRDSLRSGGNILNLRRRGPIKRRVPLVILCDISGSMNRYSRMLLHFAHGVSNAWASVHTFTFGTRLTNISRYLKGKDVDMAVNQAAGAVKDWDGGTRIGACLREFNYRWARRVLAQGAIVILVTDGLDRDDGNDISNQIERVQRSCRRLIWLNPLLRFKHFEPLAAGVKALLPFVDDFRSAHNIASLAELGNALSCSKRTDRPMQLPLKVAHTG